ncbi:hypothetical protein GWI33_014077 [Rhynchophorus ferrugineus]|uniref:Uncharacterized protein n=1 Tax=Rhynchophorus ferrugineus TaxID=354439 RepID=A0A834M9F6_RHYFE|nr:hypothetical protein GWI33_014077 [Rhynchophorus ferrugineus]
MSQSPRPDQLKRQITKLSVIIVIPSGLAFEWRFPRHYTPPADWAPTAAGAAITNHRATAKTPKTGPETPPRATAAPRYPSAPPFSPARFQFRSIELGKFAVRRSPG